VTREEFVARHETIVLGLFAKAFGEIQDTLRRRASGEVTLIDAAREGHVLMGLLADARRLVRMMADDALGPVPGIDAPKPGVAVTPAVKKASAIPKAPPL
jgi:hypothetical protein